MYSTVCQLLEDPENIFGKKKRKKKVLLFAMLTVSRYIASYRGEIIALLPSPSFVMKTLKSTVGHRWLRLGDDL